ncbi:hypothetical protein J5J86_23895 [Aquabacter sp. L1I39]|uniref:hypothetical protein n=1 Tax=Aquabacter sp. L1I39 TaxID=2820278 RepID=UPI001ADD3B56|nr:hypothetical protein [Aquabacter sp. L1I39]QTL03728.1 hypothetical protein J5J86_23895 [Aquabacter sp. L1I39]
MSSDPDKNARLASALRANLARRKAQGRARQAAERDPEAAVAGQGASVASPGEAPARREDADLSTTVPPPEGEA